VKEAGSKGRRLRCGRLAGLALLAAATDVFADDAGDHLNVRPVPVPSHLPSKPQAGFELPPVVPMPIPNGPQAGASVPIRSIIFEGNTAIATETLAATAAPYLGRRVTAGELADLRNQLTRLYIERGYVNSGAVIGADAYSNGALTVKIVEGRLQETRLQGMEGLHDAYVADRLATASPLNVNALQERFQLLLADPLFARLNARLLPGSEPGKAILDVDVTRAQPYQLSLVANNYLPPSIGSGAVAATGGVRNVTGYGDALDFMLQDGYQAGSGNRYSLAWSLPLNARGTTMAVRIDHGRSSVLEEPMAPLDIKSTIDSREFEVGQVLVEDLKQKLGLGLVHSERKNQTTLLGVPYSFVSGEPNGLSKVRAWRFWQEYVRRSATQVLALRSTFSRGTTNMMPPDPALPAAVTQPDRAYGAWLGQLQYAHRVMDNGAQVVVRAALQETGNRLTPLERMSIGGVNTVRGYRENALVRDTGSIASIEFHYPAPVGDGHALTLIPFLDHGAGRNIGESRESLRSAGVALNWRYRGFVIDFAKGWRLTDSPSATSGNLQDRGVHLQVRYNLL
jgi:hemolysin activation/secretion protein